MSKLALTTPVHFHRSAKAAPEAAFVVAVVDGEDETTYGLVVYNAGGTARAEAKVPLVCITKAPKEGSFCTPTTGRL